MNKFKYNIVKKINKKRIDQKNRKKLFKIDKNKYLNKFKTKKIIN